MDSLTALEPELVAALREGLADVVPRVHVLVASDLADVLEEKQLTPAVHVLYQGFALGGAAQTRSDGTAAKVVQTWLVVVATRHVRDVRGATDGRQAAGELAARVAGLLMGHRCPSAAGPLLLTNAPSAGFSGGFQYLPLAFTADVVLKKFL